MEGKDKLSATLEWETWKKNVEHVGKSRRGKDEEEEQWPGKGNGSTKNKRNAQISWQVLREESDNPRGGTQRWRFDGHQEISKKNLR